jgi:arginyl-tRNA synthetase
MRDGLTVLTERLTAAFATIELGSDPVVRASDRADFQANGALALAKRLGRNPREIAELALSNAVLDDVCEQVEISGPGFINLTLSAEFVSGAVASMSGDVRLGVEIAALPKTVLVDYSGPNVAKEMHVGHLRTTVIGDALCRMLVMVGHSVIRENHIGDWGTPFGMLIEHLLDVGETEAAHELSVGDLDAFYLRARVSFDADEAFRERSRLRVVALQSGDPETLRLWHLLVAESVRYFNEVYARLDVLLVDDDIVGESFYNDMLPRVVAELDRMGLLVEDAGAQCVFPAGFVNRAGAPLPLIIQKSDGGYGYAATDLAAIWDRAGRLGADELLYVVDARQSQHLDMCFAVARMANWLPEGSSAEHVVFGTVFGPDHKPLKSRAGDRVKLVDLLDEAVERASAALAERGDGAGGDDPELTARMLGVGAVKYADLSTDRGRDYVFDWDRMLTFEGNTGPYLQYAHARICSIFRRSEVQAPDPTTFVPVIEHPNERALAMALLAYGQGVQASVEAFSPSKLCAYLFTLASSFTAFYEHCPVLRAPDERTRRSRLMLADVTARVLESGLGLLGIGAPEQM